MHGENTLLRYEEMDELLPSRRSPGILLIGTPEYWNLGDHAIAMAERRFLRDMFPESELYEIPGRLYEATHSAIKERICPDDIIVITGGGFLGSLWIREENMVRSVITECPDNKVIILPQTIYFEDTEQGKKEFKISKDIYEAHGNLHICLRDFTSYEFVKQHFKVSSVGYFPDMVLYLKGIGSKLKRQGVLCCFRTDKEGLLSEEKREEIRRCLKKQGMQVTDTSTVMTERFHYSKGEEYCKGKIDEFALAELVITDRLHGMIFAAITGTPCIAFDNCSGKVSGVYEWIKSLGYIRIVKEDTKLSETIEEMWVDKGGDYDNQFLMPFFYKLKEVLM